MATETALPRMQSKFPKIFLLLLAIFVMPYGLAQLINFELKNSILQHGNNNTVIQNTPKITKNFITNNYVDLNLKNATDDLLANHLNFISDANAEKAEKNHQYVLASEIYIQLYQSYRKTNRKNDQLINILLKIATLQEKFNNNKAIETYKIALNLEPNNIICLEKIAITNLNALLFDEAILALKTITNVISTSLQHSSNDVILYLTYYRLAAVYSTLELHDQASAEAIKAAKIFNTKFSKMDRIKYASNQRIFREVFARNIFENTLANTSLIDQYIANMLPHEQTQIEYFGPYEKKYYISVVNKSIINTSELPQINIKNIDENPIDATSYYIGSFETQLNNLLKKFVLEITSTELNTPEARRIIQKTYNELILASSICDQCPIFYRANGIANYVMSNYYKGNKNFSEEYYYLITALRNFQLLNEFYKNNPQNLNLLGNIYERIGDLRSIEDPGLRSLTSILNPLSSYQSAIKVIDNILLIEPNSSKYKIFKLKLLQKIGKYYYENSSFKSSYAACSDATEYYKLAYANVIYRDKGFNEYSSCQYYKIKISAAESELDQFITDAQELINFSDEQNIKYSGDWLTFMSLLKKTLNITSLPVPVK